MPQQIIKDRLVEALKITASWPGAGPRGNRRLGHSAASIRPGSKYARLLQEIVPSGYTPANGFRLTTRSK
jgi:hypothetical protein